MLSVILGMIALLILIFAIFAGAAIVANYKNAEEEFGERRKKWKE